MILYYTGGKLWCNILLPVPGKDGVCLCMIMSAIMLPLVLFLVVLRLVSLQEMSELIKILLVIYILFEM